MKDKKSSQHSKASALSNDNGQVTPVSLDQLNRNEQARGVEQGSPKSPSRSPDANEEKSSRGSGERQRETMHDLLVRARRVHKEGVVDRVLEKWLPDVPDPAEVVAQWDLTSMTDLGGNGETLLQTAMLDDAAKEDGLPQTLLALGNGAALRVRDCHGRTPLVIAAHLGDKNLVRLLLHSGADVDQVALVKGVTPDRQKGRQQKTARSDDRLLSKNTQKSESESIAPRSRCSALAAAALAGHLDVVHQLLDAGANPTPPYLDFDHLAKPSNKVSKDILDVLRQASAWRMTTESSSLRLGRIEYNPSRPESAKLADDATLDTMPPQFLHRTLVCLGRFCFRRAHDIANEYGVSPSGPIHTWGSSVESKESAAENTRNTVKSKQANAHHARPSPLKP